MNDVFGAVLLPTVLVGAGATAVIDLWGPVRRRLFGIPPPNYGLVGRWLAYMPRGKFRHDAITAAPAVRGEHLIGWSAHYLIGIAYAAILVGICGPAWLQQPALAPALLLGVATVAAPFFLMQPGMGAGIAASRTPQPGTARLHSLLMHTIFGIGLYAAGWATRVLYLP